MRDGLMATGSSAVMKAGLTCISGMSVDCVFLVVWLSSLVGVRSCGCHRDLRWLVGLLELFGL